MQQTSAVENVKEEIRKAAAEVLRTGSNANKLYLRVRPDGTVDTSEETSWCCSEDEYYSRVPHTLSLEILKSERDYSSLSDGEIEECADNADDESYNLLNRWEREIDEWVKAGNLEAAVNAQ